MYGIWIIFNTLFNNHFVTLNTSCPWFLLMYNIHYKTESRVTTCMHVHVAIYYNFFVIQKVMEFRNCNRFSGPKINFLNYFIELTDYKSRAEKFKPNAKGIIQPKPWQVMSNDHIQERKQKMTMPRNQHGLITTKFVTKRQIF